VLDWIFSGTYAGAGIGGGDDGDGGNVTITGGEVVCLSGRDTAPDTEEEKKPSED